MNQQKFVGVDTHKDSLACYTDGEFKQFPTTLKGFKQALKWTKTNKWAIEGAYCFGRPFAAYLIKNGQEVYEVNPFLTKAWRQTLTINGKKNDYGDAKVISMFAHTQKLQPVSLNTVKLKELLTSRKLILKQRTQITNSIKMLFSTRGIDLPYKDITTQKSGKWLLNQDDIAIKNLANVLVSLNQAITNLEKQIENDLPEEAKKLLTLKGIKTINAAIIYTETKGKLVSAAALASYCGVAPVEYGSGKKVKYITNKTGNRTLNSVFYRLSIMQSRYDEKAIEYYKRKLSEGKTPKHARKCLARQLVNIVYRLLTK